MRQTKRCKRLVCGGKKGARLQRNVMVILNLQAADNLKPPFYPIMDAVQLPIFLSFPIG